MIINKLLYHIFIILTFMIIPLFAWILISSLKPVYTDVRVK